MNADLVNAELKFCECDPKGEKVHKVYVVINFDDFTLENLDVYKNQLVQELKRPKNTELELCIVANEGSHIKQYFYFDEKDQKHNATLISYDKVAKKAIVRDCETGEVKEIRDVNEKSKYL